MKKIFNMLAVSMLVLVGLAATASAQDGATKRVQIDFDFYAGKKLMPAGEYVIKLKQNTGTHKYILVKQVKGDGLAIVPSVPSSTRDYLETGSVRFNKYGDQYFLSGVQMSKDRVLHTTLKSRTEREVLRKIAGNERGNKPEKVTTQSSIQ
jgi:hypothetical protein